MPKMMISESVALDLETAMTVKTMEDSIMLDLPTLAVLLHRPIDRESMKELREKV